MTKRSKFFKNIKYNIFPKIRNIHRTNTVINIKDEIFNFPNFLKNFISFLPMMIEFFFEIQQIILFYFRNKKCIYDMSGDK